jgi:hypothetical protein
MRKFLTPVIVLVSLFFCSQQLKALTIDPNDSFLVKFGNETSQSVISGIVEQYIKDTLLTDTVYEYYKADVPKVSSDPVVESGTYASYYDTTFMNDPVDPRDADIVWNGSDDAHYIVPSMYLLVKDGNQTPAWYLFDLSSQWDGKADLQLRDFWPGGGAISHVTIYGGQTPVPEPATMILFGTGLAGLAGIMRKKRNG